MEGPTSINPKVDSRFTNAKVEYESAMKAMEVTQSTMEIAGTRTYELDVSLLNHETCQP